VTADLIEFDVDRMADYCHRRGQSAYLRVGIFVFQVNTADGLSLRFGINVRGWEWGWDFGADR
jgi:hypothetical protein